MHRRFALAAMIALGLSMAATSTAGAASIVVLGSAAFAGPQGSGWGTSRPAKIYNGGDASGQVREIQWASWGGKTAIGYGLNAIFKPHGGYYPEPVLIELRASGLGKCSPSGPRAYTHLSTRVPGRPEGPLGPWSPWPFSGQSLCKFGFGA
jgi:hypothetical protein